MSRVLQELVREQAQRRPDAPAVSLGAESLTYGTLERLSDGIAAALRGAGCRAGNRVCLVMAKSPRAVAGLLGVLKADCVYVPVDPGNPPARFSSIVASTEPAAMLVDSAAHRALAGCGGGAGPAGMPLGWMEPGPLPRDPGGIAFSLNHAAALSDRTPSSRAGPADPAYILFTSGSTGVPKGVVITHDNVLAFLDWAVPYFALGPADRLSGHSPLHFDLSMFDIFGAQAVGAELHLVPADLNLMPQRLAEFIRDRELTQWFSVPSILALLAKWDLVREGDFPALRRLLWCGEVFPTPALIHFMRRLPHVEFTNLYGPTEATIASSHYTIPSVPESEGEEIPIGQACAGEELLILDDALHPVPEDAPGNLYLRGVGLSPGYWRDPERTAAAFVREPATGERLYRTGDLARKGPDGLVYFLGRADSQIKSRGYRIELGEIESALAQLDYVAESAVVAIDSDGFEGKLVCCAYAPRANGDGKPSRLRKDLRSRLPTYMIPSRWLVLDRLPRNANGKIDRRDLALRFGQS